MRFLAPNIEKNRIFKVVLSVFILSGLITPIFSIINNAQSFESIDYTDTLVYQKLSYDENILQDIEDNTSASLYPIIGDALENIGISNEFGLKLYLDYEKEGIIIKSVNITISDLHSIEKEDLQEKIVQNTGLPINIVVEESEKD